MAVAWKTCKSGRLQTATGQVLAQARSGSGAAVWPGAAAALVRPV